MSTGTVEQGFDVSDENTVRISIAARHAIVSSETELQRAQSDVARLRKQRDQQLALVRLQCEEIIQIKALQRTMEKENAVYKAMIDDLMVQVETLSPIGTRRGP